MSNVCIIYKRSFYGSMDTTNIKFDIFPYLMYSIFWNGLVWNYYFLRQIFFQKNEVIKLLKKISLHFLPILLENDTLLENDISMS